MNTAIELTGLDGANPLAFLAALGTLRTLTRAWPEHAVKLAWRLGGKWMPVLIVEGEPVMQADVLAALFEQLSNRQNEPQFTFMPPATEPEHSLKKITSGRYRQFVKETLKHEGNAQWTDFAATWGCEIKAERKKEDVASPTSFDFTAGNQGLLQMVRDTIEDTAVEHLKACLFEAWLYQDEELSLRWDLLDETRRYALQATDPSNTNRNPIRTMRGANRLAVEALPLFPVIPERAGVQTTGFAYINDESVWTWPIWSGGLIVDVVRSVLANTALCEPKPDRTRLKAQGIDEIYRSRVVMPAGYYRCFAPPQAV